MVRIIIAGSRDFNNYKKLETIMDDYLKSVCDEVEIICGGARGADSLGEIYTQFHNIKCVKFPADWDKYGKSAGYRRNVQMAEYAEKENGILFAFWDGQSKGTKHMIDIANQHGLEIHIINNTRITD